MIYVVGGGISGLLSAYRLSKISKFKDITIIEPNKLGGEFVEFMNSSRWFYYTTNMEQLLFLDHHRRPQQQFNFRIVFFVHLGAPFFSQ